MTTTKWSQASSDRFFTPISTPFTDLTDHEEHEDTRVGGLSRPPTTRNAFRTTSVLFFVIFVFFVVEKIKFLYD